MNATIDGGRAFCCSVASAVGLSILLRVLRLTDRKLRHKLRRSCRAPLFSLSILTVAPERNQAIDFELIVGRGCWPGHRKLTRPADRPARRRSTGSTWVSVGRKRKVLAPGTAFCSCIGASRRSTRQRFLLMKLELHVPRLHPSNHKSLSATDIPRLSPSHKMKARCCCRPFMSAGVVDGGEDDHTWLQSPRSGKDWFTIPGDAPDNPGFVSQPAHAVGQLRYGRRGRYIRWQVYVFRSFSFPRSLLHQYVAQRICSVFTTRSLSLFPAGSASLFVSESLISPFKPNTSESIVVL